jgi:sigma-B regulation protein RsbU (phosphoserine phosphatase)
LPGTLAQIISDVNRQIAIDVAEYGNFMTMFYLRLDPKLQKAKWVRAGHDPAILYDPRTDVFEELRGSGMALGVDESWIYEENTKSDLSEDQIILIGTDGAWETRNMSGQMFGKERVYDLLRKHAAASANEILNIFIDTLILFGAGKKFEDDVTLVVIKIT